MQQQTMSRDERINALIKRDGPDCFHPDCGKPFKSRDEITFDHWKPQSLGGTWDLENLRLMHKRCNAIKGDRMPNPDGTLPPLKRESGVSHKRAVKRSGRAEVCTTCDSGRKLGPEEYCDSCGSVPMPFRHPQWAKLTPNDCDHEGIWWCWACMSGIIERKPAILDVLRADDDSEFAA